MKISSPLFNKKLRRDRRNKANEKLDSRIRFAICEQSYRHRVCNSQEIGVSSDKEHPLIVSLTSFGQRINSTYLTIESLMEQSLRADRIILCLDENKFSLSTLPATLRKQMERGLEVHFCKDLGPYTKFYSTLQRFPDHLILTVDDDIIYPIDLIDQLYQAYLSSPQFIHCQRSHYMTLSDSGQIMPYKEWIWDHSIKEASIRTFPTGVGGVLYPPNSLSSEVLDIELFQKLSPGADDVWLKCMSLKKGTLCRQISDQSQWMKRFMEISASQGEALKRTNKSKKTGNNAKIRATFEHFKLIKKLQEAAPEVNL